MSLLKVIYGSDSDYWVKTKPQNCPSYVIEFLIITPLEQSDKCLVSV